MDGLRGDMAAQESKVPGGSGDGADSGRCSCRVYPPFLLTTDSVWDGNIATKNTAQTPSQLCGHIALLWPMSCKKKCPGWTLPDFLTKRTTQWAWSFPLYPSPFLPAWVTVVTPGGSITLLPKRLKAAAQGVGQEVRRSLGP